MDVVGVALVALALGTTAYALATKEWWTVICDGCGIELESESFCGPTIKWWTREGCMSVVAARNGWDRADDGRALCPECCQKGDRDVR